MQKVTSKFWAVCWWWGVKVAYLLWLRSSPCLRSPGAWGAWDQPQQYQLCVLCPLAEPHTSHPMLCFLLPGRELLWAELWGL